MDRPASIVRFEQFYLGHIIVGLAGSLIALFDNNSPAMAQATETLGAWFLPATLGIAVVTQIALWFYIARKGSAVAKWILVAFTAINLLGAAVLLFGFATGFGAQSRSFAGSLLSLGASALLIGAIAMLFRPDTPAWFGESAPTA